jgi:hypothetical protein
MLRANVQLLKSFAIGLRWVCAYVTNGTSPSHKLKMVNWSYRRAATVRLLRYALVQTTLYNQIIITSLPYCVVGPNSTRWY